MHGIPMSSVAPRSSCACCCTTVSPAVDSALAVGTRLRVIVSFDSLRRNLPPRVVLDPLSLDRNDLSSPMIVSARLLPFPFALIVSVLAELGGSSGSMFSLDGAFGKGLFALLGCCSLAGDGFFSSAACDFFVVTDFFPAVAADAVDRIELADGDFRRVGALFVPGVFEDAAVAGETFRTREAALAVLVEATVASDARRGRPFGSAGTTAFGDLELVAVLRTDVVDAVEIFLARDAGLIFSRGVLDERSRVDVPLLLLVIETFESEEVGREGDRGGRRFLCCPAAPAAFLRTVEIGVRVDVTEPATDFGLCTVTTFC